MSELEQGSEGRHASPPPLNQCYQQARTFEQWPQIKRFYDEFTEYTTRVGFTRVLNGGEVYARGRRYDDAVLYHRADFADKVVCELGARDGIFGAWLTGEAARVHVSDYFELWGKGTNHDLGQMNEWARVWRAAARRPERLCVERQDMTALTYANDSFDIVVSTSVIEHMYNQCNWTGDRVALREMARVCRDGGRLLLSTDMIGDGQESVWHSGTYFYSEADLRALVASVTSDGERAVKLEFLGECDFNVSSPFCDTISAHGSVAPVTSVVFALSVHKGRA